MGFPAVTYTFVNTTTADATQVNQNFTDLVNGISDGTKNISISALTAAGASTLNGAVTLGASSANLLVINGSLNSSITINTTNSYDIGSATVGLRSLYLSDAGAAARCTRIIGATIASGYTLTLPTAVPANANSKILSTTGGALSFSPASVLPGVTASKTSAYPAVSADDFIPCDTSTAFTVTLPAANAFTGKVLRIMKTTSDVNALTIARAGSDTINGATSTSCNTQYEVVTLLSDGSSAWYILDRDYPRALAAYTPTLVGMGSGGTSPTNISFFNRRIGDHLEGIGTLTTGTPTAVIASLSLPTGLVLDSAKLSLANTTAGSGVLVGQTQQNTGTSFGNIVTATGTSTTLLYFSTYAIANALIPQNGNGCLSASIVTSIYFRVPISGWN